MSFDPSNINIVDLRTQKLNIIKIDYVPDLDDEDYQLADPKEFKKYVKDIKGIVRGSLEYKKYIRYLRENMDMRASSFMQNVNNEETFKIKIHQHHSPVTLEEIVLIVFNKRSFYKEDLDPEMVAKEIMYIHFCLLVGLIPLSETEHQLVHNGFLFIPNDKVFGDYAQFISMYKEFIPDDLREKLQRIEDYSRIYDEGEGLKLFEANYVYFQYNEDYSLPTYESILSMMDNHMRNLQENNYRTAGSAPLFNIVKG